MIRTLLKEVKEYKRASLLTPVFMILEVVVETLIPLLMATIIDKGVNGGSMQAITETGTWMLLLALAGLLAGIMGGVLGSRALPKISVRPCSRISRRFHFQILTSIRLQDL